MKLSDLSESEEALIAILNTLEAGEINLLSFDESTVECPGQHLHTTPNATTDCLVYVNEVNGTLIPFLHCLHSSCAQMNKEINSRWYRAALAGSPGRLQYSQPGASRCIPSQIATATPNTPTVQDVLTRYPWTYNDILNDPRGKVQEAPEYHYLYILSLFKDDDNVWIGRDVQDSGAPGHRWRFRTMSNWCDEPSCPGMFVCPSTFKPDVDSRSEANVLQRKFLVVESDVLSRDQVGSIFCWMVEARGHKLRAVVDTAGKSLHGWFDFSDPGRIDALKEDLTALKCDPAMFKASQPCRLPGAMRDGNYQRLIYFAP